MNDIINKFLLAGDKFMPEIHFKDAIVGTYSACGPFTKPKQRIQIFTEAGDHRYIYKNELDRACFQHDMAYNKYKNLEKRTQSYKVLKGKAFEIARNSNYNGYQRGLASMVLKLFHKNLGSGV